ncbi:MAG: hypothetical protein KF749_09335 [Bacteroidetes bacterium]|nr:hypothetical protein [Bacteroidota bacterium]MCW5894828.1 hypothetical protein [Bacteroidota bacterium]
MNDKSHIIEIESDSSVGTFYTVDTKLLTCTCPFFLRDLSTLPLDDPQRLCKHLTQALVRTGIPEILSQYAKDIQWFAQQKARFSVKDSIGKTKKLALPVGAVQTTNVSRKRKYCYVEGSAAGKKLSAAIPLTGGMVSYTIGNFHASYDTQSQESSIPVAYRHMEQAIITWIVVEYNKAKRDSAPPAVPKEVELEYTAIEKEFPEESVKTISLENKKGLIQFFEVVDNFEEEEYFHLRGQVGRESIEAIIKKGNSGILFSINGTKVYTFDVAPTREESNIDLSEFGTATTTLSSDLSDGFPKGYRFIQKAVLKWLKDEHTRIVRSS